MTRIRGERGAALVEAAVTIPLLLLIAVAIFDFGRAYQTWEVLTNAAREGARYSVTPGATVANAQTIVRDYMRNGALPAADIATAGVTVNQAVVLPSGSASQVTITYPFRFIVLQPVARLVTSGTTPNGSLTMTTTATMRNEAP